MTTCLITFTTLRGESQQLTLEADSLLAAADAALRQVSRKFWFDPVAPFTVRANGQEHQVTPERVKAWREKRQSRLV